MLGGDGLNASPGCQSLNLYRIEQVFYLLGSGAKPVFKLFGYFRHRLKLFYFDQALIKA